MADLDAVRGQVRVLGHHRQVEGEHALRVAGVEDGAAGLLVHRPHGVDQRGRVGPRPRGAQRVGPVALAALGDPAEEEQRQRGDGEADQQQPERALDRAPYERGEGRAHRNGRQQCGR